MPERLFDAAPDTPVADSWGLMTSSALGRASEMDVVARLLRLGHKLAMPLVDDDGVDLIVDYRTTVQVKTTSVISYREAARQYPSYTFEFSKNTWAGGAKWKRTERDLSADVYVFHALVDDIWWVIPADELRAAGVRQRVTFRQKPQFETKLSRLWRWRDAWHVFEREDSNA